MALEESLERSRGALVAPRSALAGAMATAALSEPETPAEDPPRAPARFQKERRQVSLADETELLARAQGATNQGKPAQALRLLAEYDRRHGGGALGQERSMARILALCGLGRSDSARRQAERFQELWPSSPQAARLSTSCAGGGAGMSSP
jgi:outer membrane protein assembly factor BamD (BamD/ComL family)